MTSCPRRLSATRVVDVAPCGRYGPAAAAVRRPGRATRDGIPAAAAPRSTSVPGGRARWRAVALALITSGTVLTVGASANALPRGAQRTAATVLNTVTPFHFPTPAARPHLRTTPHPEPVPQQPTPTSAPTTRPEPTAPLTSGQHPRGAGNGTRPEGLHNNTNRAEHRSSTPLTGGHHDPSSEHGDQPVSEPSPNAAVDDRETAPATSITMEQPAAPADNGATPQGHPARGSSRSILTQDPRPKTRDPDPGTRDPRSQKIVSFGSALDNEKWS